MRLHSGIIASEVCLYFSAFFILTHIFLFFTHRSPVGKGWQSVKLSRSAALKVRILPDAPIFVSETQTAECRSSKPDVAGSIPVAHSKFLRARSFNRQNAGLQNRSFQFKSERACQFHPKETKKNVISSISLSSQFLFGRQAKSVWQQS